MNGLRARLSHRYRYGRRGHLGSLVAYLAHVALLPALMLGGIGDVFSAIWDHTIGVAQNIIDYVESALKTFWNWLWGEAIYPLYQAIRGAVGFVWGTLNQFMKDVGATFWTVWGKIEEGISKAIGWASENILYWYNQAVNFAGAVWNKASGVFDQLWGYAKGLADTIYHGLIEPIWHHLESLPGWILDNVVMPAIHAIGDIAGIAWRWIQPFVQPYIDWAEGIKDKIGTAWDMVTRLWNALWPIVSNPVGWLEDHLHKLLGDSHSRLVHVIHDSMANNLDGMEKWIVNILG